MSKDPASTTNQHGHCLPLPGTAASPISLAVSTTVHRAHGPQFQPCSSWSVNQYCSFLSRFQPIPQCTSLSPTYIAMCFLYEQPGRDYGLHAYPKSMEEQSLASNHDRLSFDSESSTYTLCSIFQSFSVFFEGLQWRCCERDTWERISQSLKVTATYSEGSLFRAMPW